MMCAKLSANSEIFKKKKNEVEMGTTFLMYDKVYGS